MSLAKGDRMHANSGLVCPAEILLGFAGRVSPVGVEEVDLSAAGGRVLAQELRADRDSPAIDVSSMDGYAVRVADSRPGEMAILGEARIGQPAVAQPAKGAVHIVTGAPVPRGAEAVIKREEVTEQGASIVIPAGLVVRPGQNIRRQGENVTRGSVVLEPGIEVSSAVVGALATFGVSRVCVHRRVRVSLLITGDELLGTAGQPAAWQLRDSNGPVLAAMLASIPWAECVGIHRVRDDLPATVWGLEQAVSEADVVCITGGVSMGDRDFAQVAVDQIGAQSVFHGLPIRPGKPMLGAIAPSGKAILGLPGNPVSVLVTARRFAMIVLRRLGGFAISDAPVSSVTVDQPDLCDSKLWLYRAVRLTGVGEAQLLPTKGSGDVASAARGDGFVEIAPDSAGQASRRYYPWRP